MWGGTDEATSIETIRHAVELGVTLIDTAPVYGMGRSEEILGKAIARHGLRELHANQPPYNLFEREAGWRRRPADGHGAVLPRKMKQLFHRSGHIAVPPRKVKRLFQAK